MIETLKQLSSRQKICRKLFLKILANLRGGRIVLRDADGFHVLGTAGGRDGLQAEVTVRDPAFYCAAVSEQSAGVGRAFMEHWWDSPQLVDLIRIFARNEDVLRRWTAPTQGLFGFWHRYSFWRQRNSKSGSRRNISAHYDLGEDFFSEFLDPSLTYSCAFFEEEGASLEEAQRAKLDRACRKVDLQPEDHLLEIGAGWGSLAIHAATNYGCRVTTTTISREQARYARDKIRRLGLSDRITVLIQDYRDLKGRFDKLISLEMIEAVGVKYYRDYFDRCAGLLTPDGAMLLQTITVDDRQFEHDSRHIDFIKRYIFPGGVLPSTTVIADTVTRATDLQLAHFEDITAHYVQTLRIWRQNLKRRWEAIKSPNRSEEFLRCWEFYFAYCEGGFRERRVRSVQILLVKPECRNLSLLKIRSAPALRESSGLGG